jgi:hypothetical protein
MNLHLRDAQLFCADSSNGYLFLRTTTRLVVKMAKLLERACGIAIKHF